jgi:hypothetical protein
MIDYKQLQSNSEDINDTPYKPYKPAPRPPINKESAVETVVSFYNNKEQYEAFVRLVGEEEAKKWMKNLVRRNSK